jgi:hypothetical protein
MKAMAVDREEILHRYRELRLQSIEIHAQALKYLSRDTLFEAGRVLGVLQGKTFILDSEEEMALVSDYAIHGQKSGTTRAIDRSRRAMNGATTPLFDAMCDSRFGVWTVERRHEVAGVVLEDVVRGDEVWLIDENFEKSATSGMIIAARLCRPEEFWISLGALVPLDDLILEKLLNERGRIKLPLEQAVDHPRFAGAIYRAAIEQGNMAGVAYR